MQRGQCPFRPPPPLTPAPTLLNTLAFVVSRPPPPPPPPPPVLFSPTAASLGALAFPSQLIPCPPPMPTLIPSVPSTSTIRTQSGSRTTGLRGGQYRKRDDCQKIADKIDEQQDRFRRPANNFPLDRSGGAGNRERRFNSTRSRASNISSQSQISNIPSPTVQAPAISLPATYRTSPIPAGSSDSNKSGSDDDHDSLQTEQTGDVEDEGLRERRRWAGVAVDDFSDVGGSELSDTDEELVPQRIGDVGHWVQTVAAGRYYERARSGDQHGTAALARLHEQFEENVANRLSQLRATQPKQEIAPVPAFYEKCCCGSKHSDGEENPAAVSDGSSSSDAESLDEGEIRSSSPSSVASSADEVVTAQDGRKRKRQRNGKTDSRFMLAMKEVERKRHHPSRLHEDLWFNESGQTNDGPLCRCSWKSRQTGVRHNIFAGEKRVEPCDPTSSNHSQLYHYVLIVQPDLASTTGCVQTVIEYDGRKYVMDGFSIFVHEPLPEILPPCTVQRSNVEYMLTFQREPMPENFTIRDLELFHGFLFDHIMELVDLSRRANGVDDGCPIYHAMPRFVRPMTDGGKELLSMSVILEYLRQNYQPFITAEQCRALQFTNDMEFNQWASLITGQLVINAAKRPSTLRIDAIERAGIVTYGDVTDDRQFPSIVHYGIRPSALTYNGNPEYQRVSKQYVKLRHLLTMKAKLSAEDRQRLANQEAHLRQLRSDGGMKRDVTVTVSANGFYRTGLYPDVVQHGLLLIAACHHARFHWSLRVFESDHIQYQFRNRALLELAFTHPSYRANFGTNADHARNTMSNCGIRPVNRYFTGNNNNNNSRRKEKTTRKRGINILLDIMSRHGSKKVKQSPVGNNERLEYLGDAVIEFLTTIHLFFMFPDLEEGGLATYRSSLVQNKHLAMLAKKLSLDDFMLYAHGPDLCHEADLRHAMANAFEAVMGAIFLDGGLETVDRIFGKALFNPIEEANRHFVWTNLPKHPLQEAEPNGDRHMIDKVPVLQKLIEFEKSTGIPFQHIRLLAKAFTRRNVGYNYLTLGHNQRLEFLGDTVLQLITSEYLYKHFPDHHEGHLSLLRSCLVNNKTQSVICDDLGMTNYIVHPPSFLRAGMPELRLKDKADLVESFLGALYVDRGLDFCKVFCRVCFYPRLKYFIVSQRWNDPKSQLQQCCLTLRNVDGGEPDIPEYRTIGVEGPTNTRVYKVAVYFRKQRLAAGCGHSVQEAQMRAAELALQNRADLFPSLNQSQNDQHSPAKRSRRHRDRPPRGVIDQKLNGSSSYNTVPYYRNRRFENSGPMATRRKRPGTQLVDQTIQKRPCTQSQPMADQSILCPGEPKKIQSLFDIKFV